ncbi:MAG: sigma-70 family RNA polymerase sigma factor [Bacteroidota bacterium]
MPRKRSHHTRPTPRPTPQEQRRLDSRSEDSRIIRAALRGDAQAYRLLLEKYHDAIRSFIHRMIHDRTQVEDLTQEAFIKAFGSLRSFNEEFAFSTWLYKIATNNCIDYIRKRRLPTLSMDRPAEGRGGDAPMEIPDETYGADGELLRSQRSALLSRAIDALPPKYRRVILLRHVEEKSYEEIARELQLPIGTVKAHIFRARELLYRRLKRRIAQY